MSCETIQTVAIDKDWEFEYALFRKNSTTGDEEAATGASMTAHFSATAGGAALGSSSTSLTERGTTGIYAGLLAAATLTTALTDYVGIEVYEVYLVGTTPVESRKVKIVATTL